MGLFSRSKKKNTPPTVYQAPAGWKRVTIAPGAAMNFPEGWRETNDGKLRLHHDEQNLQVGVTIYSIPADNNPKLDDVFSGLHGSWKQFFTEAGSVESGPGFRCVRMNTDEDVLHLMSLSMRQIGNVYIATYLMFTFWEANVYEDDRETFHSILSSLGPVS